MSFGKSDGSGDLPVIDSTLDSRPTTRVGRDEETEFLLPNALNGTTRHRRVSIASLGADYGVLTFFVLLIVAFWIALPGRFMTGDNIKALLTEQAVPGILALAVILPLAAGEFDLSIAANLGFCSVLSAFLAARGYGTFEIIALCAIVGLFIGTINAMLVVKVGVNAFIATLGVSTVLAGGNLWITNGAVIFQGISTGFTNIATKEVFGVQITFIYFLVVVAVLWYLIERTPFGRYLRATGLGRDAARLSGVRTSGYLMSAFIIAGLLAALCGVLETATFGSASPTVGPDFLLPAYAAAFLGATTIKRGMFNVWGTVVGVFLLAVCTNGHTLSGAPFWVPSVFNGLALIAAVSFAVILSKRQDRLR